jgi:hypothetical protein
VQGIAAGGSAIVPEMVARASDARAQVCTILAQVITTMKPWEGPEAGTFAAHAPPWLLADVEPEGVARQLLLARRAEASMWALGGLGAETTGWRFHHARRIAVLLGDKDARLVRALSEVLRRGGFRAERTLFEISDLDGPGLVSLLEIGLAHEDHWAVLEALETVGRVRPRADAVRPALEHVAKNHWSPGVRVFAGKVVHALSDPSAAGPTYRPFAHGYEACVPERGYEEVRADGTRVVVPRERRWTFASGAHLEEHDLEDWPKPVLPADFPTVCFRWSSRARNWVELPRDLTALHAVDDGFLVSVYRGEFGGVTLFVARDGTGYAIVEADPFQAFVEGPDGLLGIYALCHGSCQTGSVQRLERRQGRWRVTRTTTLPSAPRGRLRDPSGALLLATEAGVVQFLPGGAIEFRGCR